MHPRHPGMHKAIDWNPVCPYPEKRNNLSFVNVSPTLVINTWLERFKSTTAWEPKKLIVFLKKMLTSVFLLSCFITIFSLFSVHWLFLWPSLSLTVDFKLLFGWRMKFYLFSFYFIWSFSNKVFLKIKSLKKKSRRINELNESNRTLQAMKSTQKCRASKESEISKEFLIAKCQKIEDMKYTHTDIFRMVNNN